MEPLCSDATASPPTHPLLTNIAAAEQLDTQLWPEKRSTVQIFLQRDVKSVTGVSPAGGVGGGDGFISASSSSLSSPSAPIDDGVSSRPAISTEGSVPSLFEVQLAECFLPNQLPQQHRGRQWMPLSGSLVTSARVSGGNGGAVEGAVTTVRDWVRSARCSPSKEPRSPSTSRRDSLASSFASALVPRDGQWEMLRTLAIGADTDDGEERERRTRLGSRAATAGGSSSSALNSGRGWSAVDSLGSSEAQFQRTEGFGVTCASTSPQRTPLWRQIHSHPATTATIAFSETSAPASQGSSDGAAALARSSACGFIENRESWHNGAPLSLVSVGLARATTGPGRAPTLLGEWEPNRRGTAADDESYGDQPSLSGVSSPSIATLPSSLRTTTPITSTMKAEPLMVSSSPALTAHELAQLGEWRSIAEAQRSDPLSTTPPNFHPLTPPQPASERHGGGPESWRSESVSRASFSTSVSNRGWSGWGSTAQTPLNWERGGATWESGAAYGSSCPSLSCWSTRELDVGDDGAQLSGHSGGRCSRVPSPVPVSLADRSGPIYAQRETSLRSPFTSSSASPFFTHLSHRIDQGRDSDDDDSTMEEIEVRNTKRKCVESPRTSPSATPLSGSFALSLADALAAVPTRMAMSPEACLWEQQQQRRQRTVSPSVARPDEELMPCGDAETYASSHHHRDRSTFSPNSPIRTMAPSMVPMHPPPRMGALLSSSLLINGERGQPSVMGGGPLHATSVDGAAALLGTSESATGVVVEVDEQLAARLSTFCSCGSDDEPEVDTFSLERAQATMEDADAEATSALCARQRRLYLLATSQFAQDVERHGGHVDPVQMELEGQEQKRESCGKRPAKLGGFPGAACTISAGPRDGEVTRLRWGKYGDSLSLQDGMAPTEEEEASSFLTAAHNLQPHSPHARPPLSVVSCAPPSAPPAASVALSRTSGEERLATPLHRGTCTSAAAIHVRWSEPDASEDGCSPGSVATTTGSRRDVSPPIRERSMAPAELQKEREGYRQTEDGSGVG
ncbi:hypothetical protein MNV84_02374 [Leishmania braziliensis]|nr:hypothetical protein MNV84_02374 [Leishmania braziliensis]